MMEGRAKRKSAEQVRKFFTTLVEEDGKSDSDAGGMDEDQELGFLAKLLS